MATTADYLTQLQADKQVLVNNLITKGVEATADETFTSLVPKVLEISSGGAELPTLTSAAYLFYGGERLDAMNELIGMLSPDITNFQSMYSGCSTLTEAKTINTSNGTKFNNMYANCSNLTKFTEMDTSKGKTFNFFLSGCSKLTEYPNLDLSNATEVENMLQSCTGLTIIPSLYTPNVKRFGGLFNQDKNITTIGEIDGSSADYLSSMFNYCTSLANFGGIKDLGKGYSTSYVVNYSSYTLTLSSCPLTHDSLMNVINKLYDIATKGCRAQKLQLGSTNLAKLSEEEIAIATNKGWNVTA